MWSDWFVTRLLYLANCWLITAAGIKENIYFLKYEPICFLKRCGQLYTGHMVTIPSTLFAHFAPLGLVWCAFMWNTNCLREYFHNSAYQWIRFKCYFKCSYSIFLKWNMSKLVKTYFLKVKFLCSTCEAVWYGWSSFLSRQSVWNNWIRGITEYIWMIACGLSEQKDTQVQYL